MEPFIDGGIFEILFALAIGYTLNYIFFRKYLLLLYSAFAIGAPMLLLVFNEGELFYILVTVCTFNAALLIYMLWKKRKSDPLSPVFDLKKTKGLLSRRKSTGIPPEVALEENKL